MGKFLVPDVVYKAIEIERANYRSQLTDCDIAFFERMAYDQVRFYPEDVKATPARHALGKRIGLVHLADLKAKHKPFAVRSAVLSGDTYYDWMVVPERIASYKSPVFICAGAGINVSFEIGLAQQYADSILYILDPTPHTIKHFAGFDFPPNVEFIPVGLGNTDGMVKFYQPHGGESLSTMHLNPGDQYFNLPITRLTTFCAERAIDLERIAFLKFDIEGAEHAVIDDLLASRFFPDQVACEFDQPCPPWTVEASFRKMIASGYDVAAIWDANALFTRVAS